MTPTDDKPTSHPPKLPASSDHDNQVDTLTHKLATALNAEDERRLHPLTWVYSVLSGLQSFIIPILFLWLSGGEALVDSYILGTIIAPIVGIFFILMMVAPIIKYLTYRFVIQAGDIRIRSGLFNKQVRHIPLAKIHNVSLQRNVLHRLMGVAEVRLESAGSGQESEAVMSVLSLSDALLLEQAIEQGALQRTITEVNHTHQEMFHVKHHNPNSTETTDTSNQPYTNAQTRDIQSTPTTLLTLKNNDIVRYGLISNAGLALGGILTFISNPEVILQWLRQTLLPNPDVAMAWGILVWLGLSVAALLSFIVLAKTISIISAYISLYQFSLQDNSQYVTIEKGLFTRNKSRMPLNKVQVWRIEQTWLHRLFRRQRLLVDSAILKGTDDAERGINELVPIATPEEMQHLLQRWEQIDVSTFNFSPPHQKAWRRIWFAYIVRFSLLALPIIGVALAIGIFDTVVERLINDVFNLSNVASSIWTSLVMHLLLMLIAWLIVISLLVIPAKKRARFMGVAIGAVPNSTKDIDSSTQWLIWRDGWLTKKWIISEVAHCHGLQLNQSPFDRRYDMANLTVDTVGGTLLSARLNLLYLPMDKARQLQLYIREQVG